MMAVRMVMDKGTGATVPVVWQFTIVRQFTLSA
jgi:hypothetical protein